MDSTQIKKLANINFQSDALFYRYEVPKGTLKALATLIQISMLKK